jgi:sensor histidine kinase YesM
MRNTLLKKLKDIFKPEVTDDLVLEIDSSNRHSIKVIAYLAITFEVIGLFFLFSGLSSVESVATSIKSVLFCIVICIFDIILIKICDYKGEMNHRVFTAVIVITTLLLILWGMDVSFNHFKNNGQILTFYVVMVVYVSFFSVRPYLGMSVILGSFSFYYLCMYFHNGAQGIQTFNYFTFAIVCTAGSITRYNVNLRQIKSNKEIARLNKALEKENQNVKNEVMEKELELSKTRIRLMQSQISPHFIFNALGIIKSLIWEDQEKADNSISDFSVYLRRNIEALETDELIDFKTEIEHVKAFLDIETADDTVDITVEYDFKESHFKVPALTIEPLVENAVIHGVSKLKENGRIIISTELENGNYVIRVKDNGKGFDTEAVTNRVGIKNVRTRLEYQCKGQLKIESNSSGTTATIFIPKEEI